MAETEEEKDKKKKNAAAAGDDPKKKKKKKEEEKKDENPNIGDGLYKSLLKALNTSSPGLINRLGSTLMKGFGCLFPFGRSNKDPNEQINEQGTKIKTNKPSSGGTGSEEERGNRMR